MVTKGCPYPDCDGDVIRGYKGVPGKQKCVKCSRISRVV